MENNPQHSRRDFIKKASVGLVGLSAMGFSAKSYARIVGSNDRVRVGIVGFSNRFRSSLFPCFMEHAKAQNFLNLLPCLIYGIGGAMKPMLT